MSSIFQGFGGSLSDDEVWQADLHLADLAEPLGFESIWSVEHHFSNYTMCPDVLQFLTYMAGRTKTVKLGSMVLVLPWHDPVRAAEQIIMLDQMSQGRLILGLGRGTGKIEFDGFRVEMSQARQQFKESAEAILAALETGVMEYDGEYVKQPRIELHLRRAAGHVGQELQHVGAHRVVGEVVLDAPDRLVAEGLGQVGQGQVRRPHLLVRQRPSEALEDGRHADVHREPPIVVGKTLEARPRRRNVSARVQRPRHVVKCRRRPRIRSSGFRAR